MPTPTLRSLGLGLSLLAAVAAQAQPKASAGHHGPGRAATTAYLQAQVLPALRQQRQQLETQLASADQATLAACRARLAEVRPQIEALHQRLRDSPDAQTTLTEADWQQLHTLRRQEWAALDQVQELAKKYERNLHQLAQQLQPQRQRWATELQALQPAPADAAEHHHGRHGSPLGSLLRPTAFLLLEPAAAPELAGTSLYPNPATAASQLRFAVAQAGPVRVELLDAQGQPLRPLLAEETRQPGTYTQPLNLGDLAPGTYYYKVTTAAGSEVKRFVRE